MTQSVLIHCRRPPYGNSLARACIEFAMAAAVFNQSLHILFSGDGIWQLLKEQNSQLIPAKNHAKMISALPLYGAESIYVDKNSLRDRSLSVSDLAIEVEVLSNTAIQQLMKTCTHVFNF